MHAGGLPWQLLGASWFALEYPLCSQLLVQALLMWGEDVATTAAIFLSSGLLVSLWREAVLIFNHLVRSLLSNS